MHCLCIKHLGRSWAYRICLAGTWRCNWSHYRCYSHPRFRAQSRCVGHERFEQSQNHHPALYCDSKLLPHYHLPHSCFISQCLPLPRPAGSFSLAAFPQYPTQTPPSAIPSPTPFTAPGHMPLPSSKSSILTLAGTTLPTS